MPLAHQDVEVLRDRRPGWERIWGVLCRDLMTALDSATAERIGICWPDDNLRQDFIAEIIGKYHRKAVMGSLLTGYTCACTDPAEHSCGAGVVSYLTGRKLLRDRALKFIAKESRSRSQDQPLPPPRDSGEFDHLVQQIQDELERFTLRIEPGQEIRQVVEMAGIQLYPRLDWCRLTQLRHWLRTRIPPPPARWKDCFELLEHLHDAAQERLKARLDDLAAQRWNGGHGVSRKKDDELRDLMDQAEVERIFKPLSKADLMCLLSITDDDAAQRRSRYYRALPDLLPRLRELYEMSGDMRANQIPDHPEKDDEP